MPDPILLALDIGSTHCKVGLFALDGACRQTVTFATPVKTAPQGSRIIDPAELWRGMSSAFRNVVQSVEDISVAGIGIASMAESGLLVERRSGKPLSSIYPWFDTTAAPQVDVLKQAAGGVDRFESFGIRPTFKCSLAKILHARNEEGIRLHNAVWLSVADYLAFLLTGNLATDYSLACRTYAFKIFEKTWDTDWLKALGLPVDLFPAARPATEPVGKLSQAVAAQFGLPVGIPVCIAGHDHVCAALAVGAIRPGIVLDSMGTAETLCGALSPRRLGLEETCCGFSIGCHVAPEQFYWQGGLSTAGGAIEWLRSLPPGEDLSYNSFSALIDQLPEGPGDILFFPYLAGAGAPHTLPQARGAFIGLKASHTYAHLALAVLEGTAYEVEYMRRAAEALTQSPIERVVAAGGGVRNKRWMQIKANVTGCKYQIARTAEAVLLGAALVAGLGAKLYPSCEEAMLAAEIPLDTEYLPDERAHMRYRQVYQTGFLPLQEPLREYYLNQSRLME